MALSTTIAAAWAAMGFDARSTTTHPAYIAARRRSAVWEMTRAPDLVPTKNDRMGSHRIQHATTRMTAGFRYVGPPLDTTAAAKLCA